jgi:hypothetical protein
MAGFLWVWIPLPGFYLLKAKRSINAAGPTDKVSVPLPGFYLLKAALSN